MAEIRVTDLTFGYDGNFDNVFENVSFSIDTDWKLGFIGRNGKGKTTFANLLLGKYEYSGTIVAPNISFQYFPFQVAETDYNKTATELLAFWKNETEEWRVICELNKLAVNAEVLYRPFGTLSPGERVKVMLAVLFSGENEFLIIDESTNHLDVQTRQTVKHYLMSKKGFMLISHDRDFMDGIIDHVLVLNRKTIEVQNGNFSSWWENKVSKDAFSERENAKHIREIGALKRAADKSARWAEKNENTKIGFDPVREHDRCISTRSFIGAKTKKLQSRVKSYEVRVAHEIKEKEGLLADIESPVDLKLMPQRYRKDILISARDYSFQFEDSKVPLITHLNFTLRQGERVFLYGENGCGKSTFIKQILAAAKDNSKVETPVQEQTSHCVTSGELQVGSGLQISYISQNTDFLHGTLKTYCRENGYEESLMLTVLRQLDLNHEQFEKPMENYSEGQKKKVLIAANVIKLALKDGRSFYRG